MQMTVPKDVYSCAHQLLGLMLRTQPALACIAALYTPMAKTPPDNVWPIALNGALMVTTAHPFAYLTVR